MQEVSGSIPLTSTSDKVRVKVKEVEKKYNRLQYRQVSVPIV
jgi:hypothetical protein